MKGISLNSGNFVNFYSLHMKGKNFFLKTAKYLNFFKMDKKNVQK